MTDEHITRRSIVKAGAWSVPVIAAAAAIPVAAASTTGNWVVTSTFVSYVENHGSQEQTAFGVMFGLQGATKTGLEATTWELILNGVPWIPALTRNLDQGGDAWFVAFNGAWPFAPDAPVDGYDVTVNVTAHTPTGDRSISSATQVTFV